MMGKLTVLEHKSDVREALQLMLQEADKLEGVMILGLTKEGGQMMQTSTMSGYQKGFLIQFATAWMSKWFDIGEI